MDVPIVVFTTGGVLPLTDRKRKRRYNMVTGATSLRRREPAVCVDHLFLVPVGLVVEHSDKSTPSDITDGAEERSVLYDVSLCKVFDTGGLVLAVQVCRPA